MTPLKRYFLWSLGLHLLVLVLGCIITALQGNKSAFVVFGAHSRYNAKIHYNPVMFKNLGGKKGKKGGSKSKTQKAAKKSGKKKATPATKKAAGKPKAKKHVATQPAGPKKSKQKKLSKKTPIKELLPEKELEKEIEKPQPEPPKKQEKPPEPEPQPQPEPEPEPIQEPEKEPEPQPVQEPMQETATDETDAEDGDSTDEIEDGFELDGDYSEAEIAQFHRLVQQEIDRLWRPPVGVPQGTTCSIVFTVNEDDGTVEECTFAKRSRVLIYDLGVMKIARQLKFHTALWGKTFRIDFKQ